MASDETAIEVSDFEFHALRKVRLTKDPLTGDNSKRLAISSSYGIGIAIVGPNRLLSYHTKDVHAQKADRTNINEEVTGVRTRTTSYFDEKASLVAVSCNCDGTLVGVLADTAAGPMVHVFDAAAFSLDYGGHISPISAVRVSADASAKARCFEWSPAAADTLVAAASDRSLMTVALKESSSYTMAGERKLGAAVRAISWSRKGKQLVIGDDLGKVIQMKPELDIVRSTMPPDAVTIANPAVVGLCWLATTDFLVVYGSATAATKDVQATIMITKKDKPITWTNLPDLNYGSPHSTLTPAMHALCLLDWNAILTTNTKSSEVAVVGKAGEAWQVWVPDELHQAALPTNAATAETFPVGAELDLSGSEQLVLSDDGQKRAPASPIASILTSDGVLMSYHTVNLKQGAASLQVASKAVNPAAVRVGAKPEGTGGQTIAAAAAAAAAPTPAAAIPAPAVAAAPAFQKSLFGVAAAPATAAVAPVAATPVATAAVAAQKASLLAQLSAAPICSPNVRPTGSPAVAGSLFGAAAPAAAAAPPAATPIAVPAAVAAAAAAAASADAAKAEKQRKLVEDREKVNALLQEVQNEATALIDEMTRLRMITAETRPTIEEMERQLKEKETTKLHGIDGYAKELDEEERRQERMLKTATIRIADRLRMVEEAGEGTGALATMRKDYDYDREESMAQLQRRIAAARTTMAEVQKELKKMTVSQENTEVFAADSKWSSDRVQRVNGTIKNIQKIVRLEREKVEDVEALVRNVSLLKMSDDEARKHKQCLERDEKKDETKVVVMKKQPQSSSSTSIKKLSPEEINAARQRLLNAKSLFPFPAPRRFVPEYEKKEQQPTAAAPAGAAQRETSMYKSSLLNQSSASSSSSHTAVNLNSPLRAQLEERLLEVTKPRKAIQLPALEKFAIKQESRPAALREPPSPIVATGAAKATAAAAAGTKPTTAFRLPEPQASSTPNKPAAAAAATAAAAPSAAVSSLFGKPTAAGTSTPPTSIFGAISHPTTKTSTAKEKESAKPKEDEEKKESEGEKEKEKTAADATAAAAAKPTAFPSAFGGASTTAAVGGSSIFGKPAATAADDATISAADVAAAATTAATPAAEEKKEEEKAKEEKKDEEPKSATTFSFGAPTTTTVAAAAPAVVAADLTAAAKPASIFGGGATTDASKPATSSIFGGGAPATGSSIFGGGAAAATAVATTAATTPVAAAPAKSIFGTPAAAPTTSSIFGGGAAASPQQQQQTKSIFGGATTAAPAPSSPFGAAAATSPTTTTSSIFGGGATQQPAAASAFGSAFGKPAPSASSFSFKSAAVAAASDTQPQPSSGFGQSTSIFGGGAKPATSSGFGAAAAAPAASSSFGSVFGGGGVSKAPAAGSFAAAAAAAAADEGMDDGGNGATTTTSAFGGGGGFMGGLGSSTSANAGRNVFGGGFGSGTTSSQTSSIFGKSTTSSFGAKPAFGSFGAAASPQQSSSAFGASSPSTATSSAFGKPAFGSGPTFGAKSIFGGGASPLQQQQPAAATSAFGGGATSGGGFAAFANQGGGFGSVAAQGGGASIFGGGVAQTKPASSIFGGGTTAATTTNKFSSWR